MRWPQGRGEAVCPRVLHPHLTVKEGLGADGQGTQLNGLLESGRDVQATQLVIGMPGQPVGTEGLALLGQGEEYFHFRDAQGGVLGQAVQQEPGDVEKSFRTMDTEWILRVAMDGMVAMVQLCQTLEVVELAKHHVFLGRILSYIEALHGQHPVIIGSVIKPALCHGIVCELLQHLDCFSLSS